MLYGKMLIEIRRAGFVNKGAELMLYAVMQKVLERYPDATLVMAPTPKNASQPFDKLAKQGFYPKAWLWRYGIQWGDFASLLPKKLQEMYGLILDKDIDVVLDAAGFSYSDQWGVDSSKELANSSRRWKKIGTKVILLPQALGPYQNPNIQAYTKTWTENVDLVFPREADSYKYLTEIVGEQEKIKLYPDFTNLVKGELPDGYDSKNLRVAIIPNYRMIDKTNKKESSAYLAFMIQCTDYLVKQGEKPFILVHEGANDAMLAEQISKAVGGIPIVKETDPIKIKGIIGTCDATIGSRFHGLVSALSQGVPSLATGWSHKYERLFEDYEFNEGVISVLASEDVIKTKIDLITQPEKAEVLKAKLSEKSEKLKLLSEEMWALVFGVMDAVEKKG
jgi:polysaccharide pyruvyl transferase WcaK-like protein